MKKCFWSFILTGIFCIGVSVVVGQKKNRALITADFRHVNMEQFVSELEKQTGLHFYFDPAHVDSIQINLTVTAQPLEKVIAQAFAGTDFNYYVDDENVYITKGVKLGVASPR